MIFFSIDSSRKLLLHPSGQSAKKRAQDSLDELLESKADVDEDELSNVCWGMIKQKVMRIGNDFGLRTIDDMDTVDEFKLIYSAIQKIKEMATCCCMVGLDKAASVLFNRCAIIETNLKRIERCY